MQSLLPLSQYVPNRYDFTVARYDFTTLIDEEKGSLKGTFNFAKKLFHRTTIESYIQTFLHILAQYAIIHETCKILDMECIPPSQKNKLKHSENMHTAFGDFTHDVTLHKLFEEEAKLSPDKIAVVYEDVKLTYRDLNEKANRLAHYLRSISNIHPDDIIALILDKSELMIISILGAWKSGAAYVPIDPNYPDERIKFILEDTKAKIVISNMKYSSRLYSYNIAKVEIDSPIVNEVLNNTNITCNLDVITNERNLAYVIYTSGTTGTPKGVLVEHQ
ncbi:unnamed protein product, partial [Rotaria sp. Silwood2]